MEPEKNESTNPLDQLDAEVNALVLGVGTAVSGQEVEEEDPLETVDVIPTVPPAPVEPVAPPVPPTHVPVRAPYMPAKTDMSESQFNIVYSKRRADVAERLKKQTKVWFMIPPMEGEARGLAYETVTIDGHRIEIKKGVMVEMPQQVAEILAEKYRIELSAGQNFRIDGNQTKIDALS